MRQEDLPDYADAVWNIFREKHQPGRLTMSSAEFHQVATWFKRGIPLPIVERGINEAGGKPRTVLACYHPVERAYEYWFKAIGGL